MFLICLFFVVMVYECMIDTSLMQRTINHNNRNNNIEYSYERNTYNQNNEWSCCWVHYYNNGIARQSCYIVIVVILKNDINVIHYSVLNNSTTMGGRNIDATALPGVSTLVSIPLQLDGSVLVSVMFLVMGSVSVAVSVPV